MRTLMTSCHLIPTWHEWNANAGDVTVTWFTYDVNLVTSRWACAPHAREHGARAINKMGASKYSNGLAGTPADRNLGKITAPHFKAKMQTRTCQTCSSLCISMRTRGTAMRIEHGVNENPSFTPTCFGTQQKVRKRSKTHFTLVSCRYHKI